MKEQVSSQLSKPSQAALSLEDLRGILLPTPTPFDSAGVVDLRALRANLERWNLTGISGYAVLGSTGERVNLDEREYLQVIEVAREAVPDNLAFIVGAGQQSTQGTVNEIKRAAAAGADAVLVITPFFYRAAITQAALVTHYTAIADASPVPVILYSMPALTGIKIEPLTIAQLSDHSNIIGVKDSSADIDGLAATVHLVRGKSERGSAAAAGSAPVVPPDEFAVLTGNGTVLCDALQGGADGGILAVGCVAPQLCIEIFRAVKAGEIARALTLQEKLTPLAQAVTTKYGIGGLKAALDFVGYAGGSVRAPLQSPDEAARGEIRHLVEEAIRNQESEISNQ